MEMEQLTALFPHIATQLRYALSNLHMVAAALAPTQARELDPVLDQRAAVLDQSFYQMLRLVNQLSAAVYLADEKPLPLRNRDIGEMVEELCAAASSLAPLKGLAFTVKNELGHHVCAVAPDELEQLVYNLLSNAFKFTPAGGTVEVELRRREGCILLTVRDSGRGIPDEQLAALFTPHADPLLPRLTAWAWGLCCAIVSPWARAAGSWPAPRWGRGANSPSPCRTGWWMSR